MVVDEVILHLLNDTNSQVVKSKSIDFEKTNNSDNEMYEMYETDFTDKSSSTFFILSDVEILQVYRYKNFIKYTYILSTTNHTYDYR